jgi:hypothetical protein
MASNNRRNTHTNKLLVFETRESGLRNCHRTFEYMQKKLLPNA